MVGMRAAQVVDELVTVGERGRMIAAAACRAGLALDRVTDLDDTDQAIEFLKDRLGPKDVVLVKGSHGMRMDRIVAAMEVES
jgi:UDP-N-acetylmuramoyl-tripeptide--D-alanyl-D-alanine ligase